VPGLLTLAVFLVGVGVRAEAPAPDSDAPRKDESKKPEVKKPNPPAPDALPNEPKKPEPKRGLDVPPVPPTPLPPPLDPAQIKVGQRAIVQFAPAFDPFANAGDGRLGVVVQKPGATLAAQLELPRGQGLAVEQVHDDSAAAKAGVQAHEHSAGV